MPGMKTIKSVAAYVRVSRLDQNTDNQLIELRNYVKDRGWTATEFTEKGVSGSKDRRPELDRMMADVRRKRFDAVLCWKLDRLGRSLKHLIDLIEELGKLDVAFVSKGEGIDTSTPAGRLQLHILGAIAEFERERLRERTNLGLDRARAQGKRLGRKPNRALRSRLASVEGLSVRKAAEVLGCSPVTVQKLRKEAAA
jgi:putative DNA-invertase from lambdoid prophage Rac